MDEGRIVAAAATAEILSDEALMKAHRLELPYRFDPRGLDS
jgi:cobalt/nickel transport system ATP-binding protein